MSSSDLYEKSYSLPASAQLATTSRGAESDDMQEDSVGDLPKIITTTNTLHIVTLLESPTSQEPPTTKPLTRQSTITAPIYSQLSPPSPTVVGGGGGGDSGDDSDVDLNIWTWEVDEELLEQFGENTCDDELRNLLKETDTLEEDADLLKYLACTRGMRWDTGLGVEVNELITVKDRLKDLYEKAWQEKKWGLVRHTAGMLGMQVEDLTKAVANLLNAQKQVTIGMPASDSAEASETAIIVPLPAEELHSLINRAYGSDRSTAMLTQELLVYLGIFIKTEPTLFLEMLRLRLGLIIQIMASELGRCLKCPVDEASDHLMNLSPSEMKTLLHHIISGKEFSVKSSNQEKNSRRVSLTGGQDQVDGGKHRIAMRAKSVKGTFVKSGERSRRVSLAGLAPDRVDRKSVKSEFTKTSELLRRISIEFPLITTKPPSASKPSTSRVAPLTILADPINPEQELSDSERQGQWLRRRRIDGSLNRVPKGFYGKVWAVLERTSEGLSIEERILQHALTQQMQRDDMSFALEVEDWLNTVPHPEYRQLAVEALVILALGAEYNVVQNFGQVMSIEELIYKSNEIFLKDQVTHHQVFVFIINASFFVFAE